MAPETWVTVLPRARNDAQLPRETLVARLAQALGVAGREQKVATYYHRMETGRLASEGVSSRVLEALSQIVGVPVERLRAAGQALLPEPPASPGTVFARTAGAPPPAMAAPSSAPAAAGGAQWDEVDELFRGGDR
jgi:hypothetical protein